MPLIHYSVFYILQKIGAATFLFYTIPMIEIILDWVIEAVIFCVQVVVYVTYFFPMLGAWLLDFFGLWPTIWPFTQFI